MNVNSTNEDQLSTSSHEDDESPRKKMRLQKFASKGWSLTDRKADQEVLQEMGVSLLEQDDGEQSMDANPINLQHKSNLKRKYDIENVNPNINSPNKCSPKSKMASPSPGPSRVRSPRSSEKLKPLQPTDQQLSEISLMKEFLVEEETPLAQYIVAEGYDHRQRSTGGRTSRGSDASPTKPEIVISQVKSEDGTDSFSLLSDEVMLTVFRWLPKRTLAHCALVCKRWLRVSCDETLWQRLDLGNKTLSKGALGKILARKPVIVRLASTEIGEWHPTTIQPSRIQYLDLSICSTDILTLDTLLSCCPALRKLSLESVEVGDNTCCLIGKCINMETLNLSMARGVTADGLRYILEGCTGLQSLNMSWCGLSEEALQVAASSLPQRLQRLNLSGAKLLNDDMVAELVSRCPRLLELDLSDCSLLKEPSVTSILALSRLEHLALSRCYYLPPLAFTKLSSMPALQYLEVWGMLQTASLQLLKSTLPAIQVNHFMFSAIARPTVGNRRTSIWGLRTRD